VLSRDWPLCRQDGRISPLEAHADFLLALIESRSVVAVMRKRKVAGSRNAVWRFYQRDKITFKKSAARGVRPPTLEARQGMFDPAPHLNPTEMPFRRLKAYLRRGGERTISRLRRRIGLFARNAG
jgi:hypothetical protein